MASVERNAKNVTATFAKTRKGKRVLEDRAPKLEEGAKKILILQGNKVSQVVKDVLLDMNKLKKQHATKFTRKNEVRPFEPGGESALQFFCERSDCSLFCLGQHSKKRPHNLVLGRLFNFQLLDMLEVGIKSHKAITSFHGQSKVAADHKPCFLFVGERFDAHPNFQLAKHLILDIFRGEVVDELNLMALDHVIACFAPDDKTLLFRQYCICMKKSGTRIPRVELEPLGPHLDLELRRTWHAPADLSKEAHTHPVLGKKKQKNVDFEDLEGKVGRIYMPKQDLATIALAKSKGTKRDRRLAAAERKAKKRKNDDPESVSADADDDMDEDDE